MPQLHDCPTFGARKLFTVQVANSAARAPSIMSSAQPLTSSGRQVLPALGLAWSNCVNTRLFVSREVGLDCSIARKLQVRLGKEVGLQVSFCCWAGLCLPMNEVEVYICL